MKFTWLWVLMVLIFQSAALAQTQVKFTSTELAAAAVLMKPELNSLELHDQTGVLTTAPSLRALGVEDLKFDLDFSGLTQIAGIRFNHLKGKTPDLRFEGNRMTLIVPVQDQVQAARSVLGTASVKNVVLRASLDWRARADGTQELYVASTGFSGTITGTGAFRPGFMISMLQKLMLKTVADQAMRIITRPHIQEAIQSGLLYWAKFATGREWRAIVPGSVAFYTEGTESGLRYLVE